MNKGKNRTTWGTAHFPSTNAALRYYQTCIDESYKACHIVAKIKAGEIFIGRPKVDAGFTVILHPDEERYYITG